MGLSPGYEWKVVLQHEVDQVHQVRLLFELVLRKFSMAMLPEIQQEMKPFETSEGVLEQEGAGTSYSALA